jgi:uncharacterized protein
MTGQAPEPRPPEPEPTGPPASQPPPGQPPYQPDPAYPGYQAYPPPAGYRPYPAAAAPMSPEDQRLWATLAHLAGLPFGFLGPLVIYLVVKERGAFVRSQAAEALNFRITIDIALVISVLLILVLIGLLALVFIAVGSLVLQIVAAVAANRGEDYRYPVNIRLVR